LSDSKDWAIIAARAASDKKAEDIIALNVAELLVVTDYFVIATGRTDRQVKTIADEVEEQLRVQAGIKPVGREGVTEAKWILLDYVDFVVHVFQPEERDFYRLEKLWGDAPRLKLPEDITGPMPEVTAESAADAEDAAAAAAEAAEARAAAGASAEDSQA